MQPKYGIDISNSTGTVVRGNDLITAGKEKAINDAAGSDVKDNKLSPADSPD
jgi:hypothetical protein